MVAVSSTEILVLWPGESLVNIVNGVPLLSIVVASCWTLGGSFLLVARLATHWQREIDLEREKDAAPYDRGVRVEGEARRTVVSTCWCSGQLDKQVSSGVELSGCAVTEHTRDSVDDLTLLALPGSDHYVDLTF